MLSISCSARNKQNFEMIYSFDNSRCSVSKQAVISFLIVKTMLCVQGKSGVKSLLFESAQRKGFGCFV